MPNTVASTAALVLLHAAVASATFGAATLQGAGRQLQVVAGRTDLLTFPHAFAQCDITNISNTLVTINSVCCQFQKCSVTNNSVRGNFQCNASCAAVIVPFMDSCAQGIDLTFDKYADDSVYDGVAQAVHHLSDQCMNVTNEDLIARLHTLEDYTCAFDKTGLYANGSDLKAQNKITSKVQRTAADGTWDNEGKEISYEGSGGKASVGCPISLFDSKLATLNKHCCNSSDVHDNCTGGVPINCDYECAKILPSFYPACRTLIKVVLDTAHPGTLQKYGELKETCDLIPKRKLIYAIHNTHDCPKEFDGKDGCSDGKMNGDEIHIDCGGSCRRCPVNSQVISWHDDNLPTWFGHTCVPSSLEARLRVVNEACSDFGGKPLIDLTDLPSFDPSNVTCDVKCGAAFVAFYDTCLPAIDRVYGKYVSSDPKYSNAYSNKYSPTASGEKPLALTQNTKFNKAAKPLAEFFLKCINQPVQGLVDYIDDMKSHPNFCEITSENLSTVVAKGAQYTASSQCRDQNADFKNVTGFTCTEIKKDQLCSLISSGLLPALCGCQCPKASRRSLQDGVIADDHVTFDLNEADCSLADFDANLKILNTECCGKAVFGNKDRCVAGVPWDCDFGCATHYRPLYKRCKPIMKRIIGPARMPAFDRLDTICGQLPQEPMLQVIAKGLYSANLVSDYAGVEKFHCRFRSIVIPTTEPTSAPTVATVAPTSPTTAPTRTPTKFGQTWTPTAAPTAMPTTLPTTLPTTPPTALPTVYPTGLPTTEAPTLPTSSPTESPTLPPCFDEDRSGMADLLCTDPSVAALCDHKYWSRSLKLNCPLTCGVCVTATPTSAPTATPTTKNPTVYPTEGPTSPTGSPTESPTAPPCVDKILSGIMSEACGPQITAQNLCTDSLFGHIARENCPKTCGVCFTNHPTSVPTSVPTGAPTPRPTPRPTLHPTQVPSGSPTPPTFMPTGSPTTPPCFDQAESGLLNTPCGKEIVALCDTLPFSLTLAKNCPLSCKKCKPPTKMPTKAPSRTPTVEPTQAPSSSPTAEPTLPPCRDSESGIMGQKCGVMDMSGKLSLKKFCTNGPNNKYEGIAPIMQTRCPKTCGTCTQSGAPTMHPTQSPTKTPSMGPTVKPTSSPTSSPTYPVCLDSGAPDYSGVHQKQCPTLVFLCSDEAWVDKDLIRSHGLHINAMKKQQDSDDLGAAFRHRCPYTCGSCIVTKAPTLRPTGNPTVSPTAVPTTSPTPAWGGVCLNGMLLPQPKRTAQNQCMGCHYGYQLSADKFCVAQPCPDKDLVQNQAELTAIGMTTACMGANLLTDGSCIAACLPGYRNADMLSLRSTTQQWSCPGGNLSTPGTAQLKCVGYGGSCSNGNLEKMSLRRHENHCGSCNAGFALMQDEGWHVCRKFLGTCKNGYVKETGARTKDNECSKCYAGFYLCTVQPDGSCREVSADEKASTHFLGGVCRPRDCSSKVVKGTPGYSTNCDHLKANGIWSGDGASSAPFAPAHGDELWELDSSSCTQICMPGYADMKNISDPEEGQGQKYTCPAPAKDSGITNPFFRSTGSSGKDKSLTCIPQCKDDAGFKDPFGNCQTYTTKGWCAESGPAGLGRQGPNWNAVWGPLSQAAKDSCCACGKKTYCDASLVTKALPGTISLGNCTGRLEAGQSCMQQPASEMHGTWKCTASRCKNSGFFVPGKCHATCKFTAQHPGAKSLGSCINATSAGGNCTQEALPGFKCTPDICTVHGLHKFGKCSAISSKGGRPETCVDSLGMNMTSEEYERKYAKLYGNCSRYASMKWCDTDETGKPKDGINWKKSEWGDINIAVKRGCCHCGGGTKNVCLGNRTQIANAVGFGNCSARALYPGESCTQAPHGGYKCSPSTCSYSPYGAVLTAGTCTCSDKNMTDASGNSVPFKDAWGNCSLYAQNRWCENEGTGPGWDPAWASLNPKAKASCCVCGAAKPE